MNTLRIFTALFFALVLSLPLAKAQDSFDAERMNRDINIMENILQEMFKTRHIGTDNAVVIRAGSLWRSGNIRGTYLPGYGVIFLIPDLQTHFFTFGRSGENNSFSFVYANDEDTSSGVTEEAIIDRIEEFLRDYGSTIGQLAPDDKVMVLYGANRDQLGHRIRIITTGGEEQNGDEISTLSVVASKQDLDAYRSGRLSADEFNKRVSVSRINKDDKKHLDVEVLANIFETAFENRQEESFYIRGSVHHLLLDNFGALFFFDASYSGSGNIIFAQSFSPLPPLPAGFGKAKEDRARAHAGIARARAEIAKNVTTKTDEKSEAEREEAIKQAWLSFVKQLKEYLVDYGRTLSSVNPNQMVLVSVSLDAHYENIPERIDVQIGKSVLEAMDKGDMSRDAALEQVVVREY